MKKRNQLNKKHSTDSILEELFLKEKYQEAISYFEEHVEELVTKPNTSEIISRSYIEIQKYDDALIHIDANLKLVKEKNLDDYAMFLIMKSEVMHNTNRLFKEYLLLQKYKKLRDNDNVDEILEKEVLSEIEVSLEDHIYSLFKKISYLILFISILTKFFSRTYFNVLSNTILISISLILVMLIVFNILFEKMSHSVFFKTLKYFIH